MEQENKKREQTFLQTLARALGLNMPLPQPPKPVEVQLPPLERWLDK